MAYRLERLAINACRRSRVVGQINKPSSTSCTSSYQIINSCARRPIVSTAFDSVRLQQQHQPIVSATSCRNFHCTTRNQDDSNDGGAAPAVETAPFTSPKVEELFNKIILLDMIEVHLLAELINEKMGLKISDAERERMARGGGGGGGGGNKGDDDEAAPAAEEKTIFDLKLTGFDAKAKIKVIKEVRAITALGLKEAKDLVEGAPSTVKKDIKMEEAEELKAKLEALGATVEIA
ncbi:ribosomal protein L12 [Skeletonema marinoi]|uniref:Ribosomal protein L12 n=1 Tax=Skeletonema marinoi TaxID=267567 RepID=A0AAD8YDM1_9STRA|nr:ribosomal protein L12 [Skeletonema marinoi]